MSTVITTIAVVDEDDVSYARQRARRVAELLGFDVTDRTRIATAVSELARNAYQYAGGGEVSLLLDDESRPPMLAVMVSDSGPGIEDLETVLAGTYASATGLGLGIAGTQRLMDHFFIETSPETGTTVFAGKPLPATSRVTRDDLEQLVTELAQSRPESPLEELRRQNRELLRALAEVRDRRDELLQVNHELDETNRGVLALYAELDEKASELVRSDELKTRFLSEMSHEFRTPLNSIVSLSRLLLDHVDGELTSEQEKQVTFIHEGAEGLTALVNDLLDLARIDAGKTVVRARPFETAELFSTLRGMFRPMLRDRPVELVFDPVPHEVSLLRTDDGKVAQILRNFIANGLKFTDAGEVRVSVSLAGDARSAEFRVADTGIGISPEDQEQIFADYVQVRTPGRVLAGTGLGLPISRRLAEMLGGSVSVSSRVGEGSTFSAVIPLDYKDATREEHAEGADAGPGLDPTRHPVLLVEDDEATRLLYEKFVRESGFQLVPVGTLEEARTLLGSVRPLAVILDILLPDGEAWDLLTELKSAPSTADIPVIVASVLDEQDRAFALGAEDYAVKPIDRAWLLKRLRALAERAPVESVLVVDDDPVARYLLKGHLKDTRYRVLEADGGRAALQLAREARPDVIFLDLMLPDMTGFEVLDALRDDALTRSIPVVIVTAHLLSKEERARLQRDAVAIVAKQSASRDAALDAVRDALRRSAGPPRSGKERA